MRKLLLFAVLSVSLFANWYLYTTLQQALILPTATELTGQTGGVATANVASLPESPSQDDQGSLQANSRSQSLLSLDGEIAPTANWLAKAQAYFDQGDFDRAIDSLFEIQRNSDLDAQQLLLNWQQQVVDWIRNGNMSKAHQFLLSFLHQQPYNTQILQIEALRLSFSQQYQDAIGVYRTIIDNSYDPVSRQRMLDKIHKLVETQHLAYKKSQQWLALVRFMEQMTYDEPEYLPYQLMLAQALLQLERFDDAKMYLYGLEQYDDFRASAQQLLEQIDKHELGQQAIALTKLGAHYLVPARIDHNQSVDLLLDTGATLSVMSKASFDRINRGAQFIRRAAMNTAGGRAHALIYRFESLNVGGFVVKDIEFAVMRLSEMEQADGLLGMNFLQRFAFQIDQENHSLILSYR